MRTLGAAFNRTEPFWPVVVSASTSKTDASSEERIEGVRRAAAAARQAALRLQASSDAVRRSALLAMAAHVEAVRDEVDAANRRDVERAEAEALEGPLVERLRFGPAVQSALLRGVRQLAEVDDPLGQVRRSTLLDDGLELHQVTVPIGVLGVVFESRPDALVQIAALAVRSGNAVLLKGGREARETNRVLADAVGAALEEVGLPAAAVTLLEDREDVSALLTMDDLVDLVIPRGSNAFVRYVMDHTNIPVMGHADGVCHVFVEASADPAQALRIVADAKTDHPSACNAVETVLVDRDIAADWVPALRSWAKEAGVRLIEDDTGFGHEFSDLVLAVGVVDGVPGALAHIARYGSRHTDAIVTRDEGAARAFVAGVDSASVMVNASTRFADGYRYGLGAEVGVSTGKVHARGPVGLEGLTTTKWVVLGQGQTAGEFQGAQAKPFKHAPLEGGLEGGWRRRGGVSE